jgi:hypothetical protein
VIDEREHRDAEQDEAQHHDVEVAVQKQQMAEGREEVLKAAHAASLQPQARRQKAGEEQWLAADTLIER